jgi:LysM repeat protein
MKISRAFLILIALLIVVGLVSCTRSIPGGDEGEQAAPTSAEQAQALTPGATNVMDQIYLFATQTAMATSGLTTGVPETPSQTTPEVGSSPDAPQPTDAQPTSPQPTEQPAQPTSPAIVVPTATPGLPASYTLKGGEFPYCIARRFNVNPNELLQINGLGSHSVYYSGMTLRIPQTGRTFPGQRSLRPHPSSYTVRSGDTIYKIACAFGDVDPNSIAIANGMEQPYKLSPGQVLNIP